MDQYRGGLVEEAPPQAFKIQDGTLKLHPPEDGAEWVFIDGEYGRTTASSPTTLPTAKPQTRPPETLPSTPPALPNAKAPKPVAAPDDIFE